MNRKAALILALIILVSPLITTVASANSNQVFTANIQTSSFVYTGQSFNVYVNSSYGFKDYTISVYFGGENMTGFSPTDTYHDYSASDGNFVISITAPETPQTIFLLINLTAISGSSTYTFNDQYKISVINPIYLHALIQNTASVPMYNISVQFYVDNVNAGSREISNLSAGSSVLINYTWAYPYLSKGQHTLTVIVNNPLIKVNGGTSQSTSKFYYGAVPNYNWIFYIVIVVAIFMAFLVYGSGRRAHVPRKPKWKK